ncbi:MAG: bifunctional (p)ppGpp synthetase/guanosine-3',5'-bis(diphosphate) 3'-pyrophosphohydrolase [Marinilabiliales bacterium]|nr:MAG: bifunctional (p)ppGpp synthetase/guanosine-3',5'-bis(diphosphate) 3'-pyrophosphohydrolase [Marinilabiliales bacterium]
MTISNPDNIQKAIEFASLKHKSQKVPGSDEPYLQHIMLVTSEVLMISDGKFDKQKAVMCAILHDILEDTNTEYSELVVRFGDNVAKGVLALTKNEKLPHEERMNDSLHRIYAEGREVAIVKMADRISNLRKPPEFWTLEKKMKYRDEAALIYEKLSGFNANIAKRLLSKINDYEAYIE